MIYSSRLMVVMMLEGDVGRYDGRSLPCVIDGNERACVVVYDLVSRLIAEQQVVRR